MNANIRILPMAMFMIAFATAASAQTASQVTETADSGRCVAWLEKLSEAGFVVEGKDRGGALARLKTGCVIPVKMFSCRTATAADYMIESHVPPTDITRLLEKWSAAIGLVVPGTLNGSPDMDFGNNADAYDVFLVISNGTIKTFSSYPAS